MYIYDVTEFPLQPYYSSDRASTPGGYLMNLHKVTFVSYHCIVTNRLDYSYSTCVCVMLLTFFPSL